MSATKAAGPAGATQPSGTQTKGRLAGMLYLLVAVTGYYPHTVRKALIVHDDAAQTVANVLASIGTFRLAVVSVLVMTALWIATGIALASLFRSVSARASILMVAFVLVGSATVCTNELVQMAALQLIDARATLSGMATGEREGLAMLLLSGVSRFGLLMAFLLFGLWLLPLGHLVFRSGYFPTVVGRGLGALLIVAALGYLADFLVGFLHPAAAVGFVRFTFVGELLLLLWLLVRGVRLPPASGPPAPP